MTSSEPSQPLTMTSSLCDTLASLDPSTLGRRHGRFFCDGVGDGGGESVSGIIAEHGSIPPT